MHTHPRVLDRAFGRLFDGEKAQDRRATLPASFLPSFLSFVLSFSSSSFFSSSSSSSSPLSLLFTRSPSTGPDTLSFSLSPSLSPRLRVYASGSDPSGVRDLARGYAALRGGWPRKENVLAASRYLSSLPLISDTTGYLLRLRARALSALRLSTMGSPLRPAVRGTFLTIPRFARPTPLGWVGNFAFVRDGKLYHCIIATYFGKSK